MSHTPQRRRGIAALTVLAAGAMLLGACSSPGQSTSPGATAGANSTVRIMMDSDMATYGYDPIRYGTGQVMFYEGLYDSLFAMDADGNPVPQLVTSFSYNADNTQLTLHLDTTSTFTDGAKLTAQLVKDNLDQRNDATLSAYASFATGGGAEIKDVSVVDDSTVTLTFASAQPGFEANLVMPAGAILGPNAIADRTILGQAPDGSGPLALDTARTVKGTNYVLTKRSDYTGSKQMAFDTYIFTGALDPQSRVNALGAGDADLVMITSDKVDQVKGLGKTVAQNGGTVQNMLVFDRTGDTAPAFASQDVRNALSIAIDRQAVVDAISPGDRPTANALPQASPGYDASLDTAFAYDPAKAKQMLADAGYPDGFSFNFLVSDQSQTTVELLQTYWAAIGVTVTLRTASSTEEAFASVTTDPMGGPNAMTWTNPAGNVFGQIMGWMNPHNAVDPALMDATNAVGAATTDADRATALKALNDAIVQGGSLMPLYEQYATWGYDQSVVAAPTFPGTFNYPRLVDLKPAS